MLSKKGWSHRKDIGSDKWNGHIILPTNPKNNNKIVARCFVAFPVCWSNNTYVCKSFLSTYIDGDKKHRDTLGLGIDGT